MATTRRELVRRQLDHEWPAELQGLWHAARALDEAAQTLEGCPSVSAALWMAPRGTLADYAAYVLRCVEQVAADLLAERGE